MKLPRFSLRALFALITLICALLWWLQTERNFVHERQQFVANLTTKQGGFWEDAEWAAQGKVKWKYPILTIPFVRKALGDRAYFLIALPDGVNKKVIDEANALFPEAMIQRNLGFNGMVDVKQK